MHARRQPQRRANHRQIQQHRGEGRGGEASIGIKDAGRHADQRDEQNVREGDAQHRDREVVLLASEARGQCVHDKRRGQHTHQRYDKQHQTEDAGHPVHKFANLFSGVAGLVLAEHRHERL